VLLKSELAHQHIQDNCAIASSDRFPTGFWGTFWKLGD